MMMVSDVAPGPLVCGKPYVYVQNFELSENDLITLFIFIIYSFSMKYGIVDLWNEVVQYL